MSKRSIKSPSVSDRIVSHLTSISVEKRQLCTLRCSQRTNRLSQLQIYIFEFTYNDFLCHLKLHRGKSSRANRRKITKCS